MEGGYLEWGFGFCWADLVLAWSFATNNVRRIPMLAAKVSIRTSVISPLR